MALKRAIVVRVTEDDLQYVSQLMSCHFCPIGRAIARRLRNDDYSVGGTYVKVCGKDYRFDSETARAYDKIFSQARPLSPTRALPFSFAIVPGKRCTEAR